MLKLALPTLALLAALATSACAHDSVVIANGLDVHDPARWAPRHESHDARLAITTDDGTMTLLLTDRTVAMQLSNATLRKVDREMRRERDEHADDASVVNEAIRSAVMGAVRSLLDHSVECPVSEIRDVRYDGGRLVVETRSGDRLFEHLEENEHEAMSSFDPADAREFAREFHRLAGRR